MSLQYLLDGYNIIHQMPLNASDDLNDQRNALIFFIEKNRPQGNQRNQVTIYFDGRPGRETPKYVSGVHSVFTFDLTADDMIVDEVRRAKNAKQMVVVTDDRAIQYSVRASGAKVLKVKEFLEEKTKGSGRRQAPSSGKKNISKSLENKINAELKDVWIKKDQKKGKA